MLTSKFDISGKNALITGGAGLLGIEHALALIETGCKVIITDSSSEALKNANLIIENQTKNSSHIALNMDVTDINSIRSCQMHLSKKDLSVDILINNAAIDPKVSKQNSSTNYSMLENIEKEQWDKEIAVGLTGAFQCSQIFGSEMANNKGGVILNIASDLSIIAPDQRIYKKENQNMQFFKPVTYSVIKTGLIGLTKYIATYWAKEGVRCNAISPGGVFNNQDQEFVNNLINLIPMGRMASKDEYRSAIQFLCSDASSYMTGFNLVMDGGRHIW
mgnify:CR=1 FL=1